MAQMAQINEEMVSFLQDYIRIDTTHPTPAYDDTIEFLKKHARRIQTTSADGSSLEESLATKEVPLPSGKKVLIMSVQGSDKSLKSLALNHHMDVVPAPSQGWAAPPFEGKIINGLMIGRGTQDMKGIGVTHFFALKQLLESGFKPKRTIHLFAVPEEEVGGFKGTKEFVQTEEFKSLNLGYIIDEGHASGIDNVFDLKVAERKPIQIIVEATGDLAHGSRLECENAIHNLVQFLNEMVLIHKEQQGQIGKEKWKKEKKENGNGKDGKEVADHHHYCQAGELLSCNITSLTAGVRKEGGHITLNIVPDSASATIDIRVPPTMKKALVIVLLEKTMAKFRNLKYKILAQADEEPELKEYQSELYCALTATIAKFKATTQPHFAQGSSDLRFYQALGIDGIGLTPFTVKDNIHGIDESVPVDQLIKAKDITAQFIVDFCG